MELDTTAHVVLFLQTYRSSGNSDSFFSYVCWLPSGRSEIDSFPPPPPPRHDSKGVDLRISAGIAHRPLTTLTSVA